MNDLDDMLDELDWIQHDAGTEINLLVSTFADTGRLDLSSASPDLLKLMVRAFRHELFGARDRRKAEVIAKLAKARAGERRRRNGVVE